MREATINGDSVRLPAVKPGTATLITRYRRVRAVLLHPDDYAALIEDQALLGEIGTASALAPPTSLERRAHTTETTPGADAPILEDYDRIQAWLKTGQER